MTPKHSNEDRPMQNFKLASTLTAASIMLATVPAHAQSEAPQTTVSTEDLDLSTDQGQRRLKERTNRAIRKMCDSGSRGVAALRMEQACRVRAAEQSEGQIRLAIANANASKVQLAAKPSANADG